MAYYGRESKVVVPQLKPSELFEKRRQKDRARLETYNKILEQIYTRIRVSSQSGGEPWILFTIPPFIIGLPKIDMQDCVVYLVFILRQQSYEVRYTYPNLLYISWKHHEKDYILKNSPIMQAMLPPAPKSSGPNKVGGSGNGSGNSARVRFQDEMMGGGGRGGAMVGFGSGGFGLGKAPARNAEDYQPPTSFLDALEKGTVAEPRASALQDFMNF